MGTILSSGIESLFDCCIKGIEHETKIALGRCKTCKPQNGHEEDEDKEEYIRECRSCKDLINRYKLNVIYKRRF